jgi:hypothetical protein
MEGTALSGPFQITLTSPLVDSYLNYEIVSGVSAALSV